MEVFWTCFCRTHFSIYQLENTKRYHKCLQGLDTSPIGDSIKLFSFSLPLACKTTDISCQEQLPLCVQYVGDDFAIEECFLQFVPAIDLLGKNLDPAILTNLF